MHENREISITPLPVEEGRSAKAINHNADMYVLEKSHCALVPVNQPNKRANALAEVGEGRAQMKENTAQPSMHPTQSGKRMSQGLDGVRKAARDRRQERFTSLLHHLSVDLLRDSFYALQRKAAPGVDGVTWQEYETGLEDRLVDLHGRVHRGAYRAQPSRRVYIPKADGRQRPLGIAAVEDKIVQQAVVTILNQIRMVAKLKAIKAELQRRKHDRTSQVGVWLRSVVTGYYQYHAVPGNIDQLCIFRHRVNRLWRNVLVRRSQTAKKKWEKFTPVLERWIPPPRVLHPYPDARFYATHPS
jgi:hypothetical protein